MKRKIAISNFSLTDLSGTCRSIIHHLEYFHSEEWESKLFVTRLKRELLPKCNPAVQKLPHLNFGSVFRRYAQNTLSQWAFRQWKPDLIWGHGNLLHQDILSLHNSVHLTSERLSGRASQSTVARIHDQQLEGARGFHALIANSHLMKRDLMARYGIDSGRIHVIYPGYDPKQFHLLDSPREEEKALIRKGYQVPADSFVILFATSGDFKKRGVETFLRTVAQLAVNPKVFGLVMGKADETEFLQLAQTFGLGERVRFLGVVDNPEDHYRAADVLLHSALIEEFGQVVQEAAVCGLPVLTSQWVGASELIKDQSLLPVAREPDAEFFSSVLKPWVEGNPGSLPQQLGKASSEAFRANTIQENCRASEIVCRLALESGPGRRCD